MAAKKTSKKASATTKKKTTKKKTTKKAASSDGKKVTKKKKRLTKAEREAQEEKQRLLEKWQELHELSEGQPAKKYVISDSYEANTSLDHSKLGWGYVLTSQNNRLEVLFEEGIKVLVSNYKM